MGGTVGLKGTDGLVIDAIARGAKPLAAKRAMVCLKLLASYANFLHFLVPSGEMGERALIECGLEYRVVFESSDPSNSEDTRKSCKAFLREGVGLILFCGGDGTARDVAAVAQHVPILGIPAGVKMHSGVFAISPEAAAELVVGFLKGEISTRETEIVDVDEELYRQGKLQTRLYAIARTPYKAVFVQDRKQIYESRSEDEFRDQIALFAMEFMQDGSAYILGAGTTTARIAELLGVEKTLLGVDVIQNRKIILKDASETDLLALLDKVDKAKIIVSPIGAQGFILGRGSQQISAKVLWNVRVENLIVVSTPHKLGELKYLLVDTGDSELDKVLTGRRQVVTGYRIAQRKDVRAASDVKIL
jgi:predicted polyphosphate/ATP-dependent NAD kinase